ncbi:MAG TPA: hypothetical protein DEO68_07950 [Halomonas campaniensis]|uniref:Uncharacterized protein n=1 Tax=Halomonas campaniensis TaxID=213554 RepID=A0A3D0KFM5_9GAMM|nr:hypothetical protein [Halomonas sp. 3F2F]HCA02100.1 hypothetical protein [Halomonas campaniensis]
MNRQHVHPVAAAPLEALLQAKASDGETFTVCELRNHLSKHPDLADVTSKRLRLYVQDQINTREKHGVIEQVGIEGKRRKVFRQVAAVSQKNGTTIATTSDSYNASCLVAQLRRDSEQLRAKMEASHLQLQALQEIADKYPDARDKISSVFEEEKAQARALGEKLKAYAKVQQMLAEVGDEA